MFKIPFALNLGIPVQVHPFYPVVAFLLAFMWAGGQFPLTLLLVLIITFSLMVHELGHALAGLFFKQKVQISLLPFGGLTERKGKPLRAWQDFIVVLMGPAFGFGLYLLAASLIRPGAQEGIWSQVLAYTLVINLFWTILNLVPVIPLDGGQLVRIVLQGIWGVKGLRAACILSIAMGALIGIYFIFVQDFLIASVFAFFAYESWTLYRSVRYLQNQDIDTHFQRLLSKGEKAYQKGDYEKAGEVYREVRKTSTGGALYNLATMRLADIARQQENFQEGYELLAPLKKELSIDGLALLHELSFQTEHWEDALFAGTAVSKESSSAEIALNNAKAASKLHNLQAAEGWAKAYLTRGGNPEDLPQL